MIINQLSSLEAPYRRYLCWIYFFNTTTLKVVKAINLHCLRRSPFSRHSADLRDRATCEICPFIEFVNPSCVVNTIISPLEKTQRKKNEVNLWKALIQKIVFAKDLLITALIWNNSFFCTVLPSCKWSSLGGKTKKKRLRQLSLSYRRFITRWFDFSYPFITGILQQPSGWFLTLFGVYLWTSAFRECAWS